MQADYQARLSKLRERAGLTDGRVAAVALVPGANLDYFTGLDLHLSERPIIALITRDGLAVIVPQLEAIKLDNRPDLAARAFAWTDEAGYAGAVAAAITALDLRGQTLGVDGMTMRVTEWLAFQAADPSLRVAAVERDLIAVRAIKAPDEIEAMRRAIQVSEGALALLLAEIAPGMTERAIAARLNQLMDQLGAEGLAFETHVQTGPNSAVPHGSITERALGADDVLLIDFGARMGGYPADITRAFCLGDPSAELQTIHATVLRANEAAQAAAGPGVPMSAVDEAARTVIAAAGYGDYFTHRTGHGLGLETHEPIPQIAAGVSDPLEIGMTFTIEPGIYVPGVGGVRIEDNVVITADGIDVLTSFPRQLRP
ncbi:MAG: aminopeptidase P family protein [Chloroflexi bacterium]|nr:aminopeptidase P family protein [Chloroflexota bacterium]